MNRDELLAELNRCAEPAYRDFSGKLLPGVTGLMGVRLPTLRRLAARIARENGLSFGGILTDASFEEVMLQGMVLGCLKLPAEELFPLVGAFVPKIDNWSVCDSVCVGLKGVRKWPEESFRFVDSLLERGGEFPVRFAVVLMLCHFVDEAHVGRVLERLPRADCPAYYARMAVAWCLSICFIRFRGLTVPVIRAADEVTRGMAVRKIAESRRTDAESLRIARSLLS